MKKSILLITAVTVLFNFSTAFSKDQDINKTIGGLWKNLYDNHEKLKNAHSDLIAIAKSIPTPDNQVEAMINISQGIRSAMFVHKYLIPTASLSFSIRQDNLIYYYKVANGAFLNSKFDLNQIYEMVQALYPYLEKKSALHTTDKVKSILRDTLSKIESVLNILSKVTGQTQ